MNPVAPGTPAPVPSIPPTPAVANKQGSIYLTNPRTGDVQEAPPDQALFMLRAGWQPNDKSSADAVRAMQIPQEVAAEQPALGKLGYGIARGVLTPLVDTALPAGNRVHEVLSEDSPWLTGGGEAAGMLGSALLGFGPVAALEEGAAQATVRLGVEGGLIRKAFQRGAQGALETGAYGAMGAVTDAHNENVPLTAQRFASEVVPGLLFGGVLGAGLGGAEGALSKFSGSLPERIAKVEKGKLDEIFRAGVSDEDALRVAQREFGVKDPTMLQQLQAAATGEDNVALQALAHDSGPVGERVRKDLFFGQEQLNAAEREVVDKGNDYLLGREEAMKQIVGDTKGRHIADMIGPGQADAADIGKLVRDHVGEKIHENADWAADAKWRERFVDSALDELDSHSLRDLERDLGASKGQQVTGIGGLPPKAEAGNLRERLMNGLRAGHAETIQALESALGKASLTDDQLRSLGAQGSWAQKPLDFIQDWRNQLEGMALLPKGVNDAQGDLKKLLGNLEHAEQSVLRDPRRVAAHQLDSLKKRLADFADAGERLGAGSGVAASARGMYEDLREILEDPTLWGPKFAGFQARTNQLLHQNIGVAGEFDNLFVKQIGKPDPDAPWRSARVVDSEKVSKGLRDMSEPKQLEQLNRIRAHLDDQKKFFQEQLDSLKLGGKQHVRIQAGIKQIDQLKEAIDSSVYLNTRARQAQGLLGYGPLGRGGPLKSGTAGMVGAVLGGPAGAVAGMAVSAALNPGKMLQFRAIAERMAESTNNRVWRGISKLMGLQVGDVARETAGFIGKSAGRGARQQGKVGAIVLAMLRERGDDRQKTYEQTVKQLVEAQQRLPELATKLDDTMPTLEQALPGTKAEMLAQAQRGLAYVTLHLPVTPKMRLYGSQSAPLGDHEYENFLRMTMAATDPLSVIEMAQEGELTPDAIAAAESSAPDFISYIRSEMARAISEHGPEKIPYVNRISASLLMGTPLDESLEPENIAIQQATHKKRFENAQQAKEQRSKGTGGETGVNEEYLSKSDQIERGAPPR